MKAINTRIKDKKEFKAIISGITVLSNKAVKLSVSNDIFEELAYYAIESYWQHNGCTSQIDQMLKAASAYDKKTRKLLINLVNHYTAHDFKFMPARRVGSINAELIQNARHTWQATLCNRDLDLLEISKSYKENFSNKIPINKHTAQAIGRGNWPMKTYY